MAGASTKMSVDVSQFKSGMQQAQATVRMLDAELKRNEAQFKATGNAEQYMADKTRLLKDQLQNQKAVVSQIEGAMKKMQDAGVSKTSTEYRKLETQLANAQTAVLNTSVELNNLATSEQEAAQGADQLAQSVSGISQKMSLDQVVRGIDKITSTMEKAAKKAVELGQAIWDNIMDSAKWSDDTATAAMLLDMNVEDYQRYKGVFDTIGELTVQDWIKAKQKVQKAIYDASDDQKDFLTLLGIPTHETIQGKYGAVEGAAREWEDVFWDVVTETQKRIQNGSMTQDAADTFFNNFFGRSFTNLKPLMKLGREGFAAALEEQNVASEDAVNKMAELNDKVTKLKDDFGKLQTEVLKGLAPALTKGAEALDSLLGKIMEYLQTPEGQAALNELGEAVAGLFEDLTNINFSDAVSKVGDALKNITKGFEWIKNNWGSVKAALEGLAVGFGLLKVSEGVLTFLQLINNGKTLFGGSGGSQITPTISGIPVGTAAGAGSGTPTINAAEQVLNGATSAATSGIDTGLGPATTVLEKVLNRATLVAMAEAAGKAFDPKNSEAYKGVQELANSGLSQEEQQRAALIHDFGMTEEEAAMFIPVEPKVDEEAAEETWEQMLERLGMQECEIEVEEIEVPDDAAEQVAEQVGTVTIPGQIIVGEGGIIYGNGGGSSGGHGFANGLWSVPWDGYPAILHRGERVLTARENRNYTFNSNHYFGNVNLNNGLEIEALTESIDRRNRRQRSGYGAN